MTCDYCGYTEAPIRKITVVAKEEDYETGKTRRRQKTVKICQCCDAWGVTTDKEKLSMITGFDEDAIVD